MAESSFVPASPQVSRCRVLHLWKLLTRSSRSHWRSCWSSLRLFEVCYTRHHALDSQTIQ